MVARNKKKNKKRFKTPKKGFTLIELLAVIVILGLLLAIAIPSVTKYITQSRKKTITTTMGNYISALTTQVNDMEYIFTETNTVYAVPIECIALERGGTDPFGKWYQANDAYWAYVLVQYDDVTSSYTYGFTFKDSAGYGLYPTSSEKLKESGSQVQTGLDLTKPENGTITKITAASNWTGFDLEDDTKLVVLEAESEGTPGNGKTTCTLCQKGENYNQVEEEKKASERTLANLIKQNNEIKTTNPNLTTSSNKTGNVSGLFVSTETNGNVPTYYFRGKVINNYVLFANLEWRVVRINEDGSVRLILNTNMDDNYYEYSSNRRGTTSMYYSKSDIAKPAIDEWYRNNIEEKGFDSYVATTIFCEQAKTKTSSGMTSGSADMLDYSTYIANFRCENDKNGYGILNLKVGMITYDEMVHAGSYYGITNENTYMLSKYFWSMSPAGVNSSNNRAYVWYFNTYGSIYSNRLHCAYYLRPVINIKADILADGEGTQDNPYVLK